MKEIDFKQISSQMLTNELSLLRCSGDKVRILNITLKDCDDIAKLGFSVNMPYPYKTLKSMNVIVSSIWTYEYQKSLNI